MQQYSLLIKFKLSMFGLLAEDTWSSLRYYEYCFKRIIRNSGIIYIKLINSVNLTRGRKCVSPQDFYERELEENLLSEDGSWTKYSQISHLLLLSNVHGFDPRHNQNMVFSSFKRTGFREMGCSFVTFCVVRIVISRRNLHCCLGRRKEAQFCFCPTELGAASSMRRS
jgi:hypothetical protein